MTLRVWFVRWRLRLTAIAYILRPKKYPKAVLLLMEDADFKKLLQDESFEVTRLYIGMEDYNYLCMVRSISNSISSEDMILSKAIFDGKVEEWIESKNNGRIS
jgi:hypothetical protein